LRQCIRPNAQDDKPDANEDQDAPTPLLDLSSFSFHCCHKLLLSQGNRQRQGKHQQYDDQGGDSECGEGGCCTASCQCVSGQTGQNGASSAKAGQDIAKTE